MTGGAPFRPRQAQGLAAMRPRGALPLAAWWAALRGWLGVQLDAEVDGRAGFLVSPVFFGLGVLLYFSASSEPQLWAPALLSALLVGIFLRTEGAARLAFGAAMMLALGFLAGTARTAMMAAPVLAREMVVEIKGLVETVDKLPRRQRLVLRPIGIEGLTAAEMPERLRIGVPGTASATPGALLALRVRLAPPADPAMPGGYDFRRDAFFRGIGGVGYAVGPVTEEPLPFPPELGFRVISAIDHARNLLTERIARAIGGEAGALSAALVTGKRGPISDETNDNLRASGLYHIVSISGLHMVLAAGVLFWLVRALLALFPAIALVWPIKKFAALAAMAGASAYCVFSGSEVATERSLIMTLVMLGAVLVDRPALAMRNVAIAALIVMAREPEALLGPSFQMSFAAVASLIAANELWRQLPRYAHPDERAFLERAMRKLALAFLGILATTLVASLATAPFSAWHFHRVNPFGLIGNALAIPLVSLLVMPSAVIGTLLVPFGLDGIIWALMGEGINGVLFVAEWVARFDHASLAVARKGAGGFALLILALIILAVSRSALRWAFVPFTLLGLIVMRSAPLPDLVIDGQARMALVRTSETGGYRLLAPGRIDRFTLSQWLPMLGDNRLPQDETLKAGVRCDRHGCVTRLADGRHVALTTTLAGLREDCLRADVLLTPRDAAPACTTAKGVVVDKAALVQNGAMRITLRMNTDIATNVMTASIEGATPEAYDRPWRRGHKSAQHAVPRGNAPRNVNAQAPLVTPNSPRSTETPEDPGLTPSDPTRP